MANVIFFPFPEYGRLNPTLKLAKGLKQAGHRVCYMGLADFEEYALSQGLEFIPILESSYPKGSTDERSARMKLNRFDLIMLENVLLVNWAPQLEMLERASIMITHGGLGAVKECIFFGVPMIVFPCKWDQPSNAARVAAHGLGVRGNINNTSARQLNSLIDAIDKDPMFKRRIDAMSKTFREIEDSGRGVKIIERILGGLHEPLADSITTEKQGGYYARNN